MPEELVQIDFDSVDHETANAWLVTIGVEQIWFPKSICLMDDDPKIKAIHIPEWLANEKGML